MTELLTAAQMRAIEQATITSGEVTGLELMERAGQGVVDAIFEEWPELGEGSHRAVVLCGPGNNGGDGFVVARLLKEAGWEVEVFLYGDANKLPPDATVNYERWSGFEEVGAYWMGDFRGDPKSSARLHAICEKADVVVDALFGTGLSRPVAEHYLMHVVHGIFDDGLWWTGKTIFPRIVAIDFPSGFCTDSGRQLAFAEPNLNRGDVAAHLTVTFHMPKVGHYVGEALKYGGNLRIVDIGLLHETETDDPWGRKCNHRAYLCGSPMISSYARMRIIKGAPTGLGEHKYSHGHALILSGGVGKGGAARLAARAALRIGAGAVTVGCPPAALIENAAQLNAIMLRSLKDADALMQALDDKRINALCLGPGMGVDKRGAALLAVALDGGKEIRPMVLDADALTLLAQDDTLFAKLHKSCILTPHAGEFARLFPDIAAKLDAPATKGPAYSKVDAAREAAKRAGCVVLFKGPDTVIADPSGRCSINASVYERSAPWLATAGSGDVLAGFITGLLARGFPPMQAAETGAWLHTECALSFGPGLIAEDLPEELPKVFRALEI